ncbi:lysophospholipase [Halobacillus rhizosphaerae]|uniref:alpha/beta hydrolase n=1 Tax=Halobacillus rhizosphaerae TaxID=3064889 RepID=UPI00398AB932
MKKIVKCNNPLGTIIIVHGAFEHAGRYHELAKRFHEDGFNVIYGDLPGQGDTPGLKGHIKRFDSYIQTIKGWIFEADDQVPLFLLGHSMGGTAVIRAMEELKPSVSGVILSSPAAGIMNGPSKPMEVISHILNAIWPSLRVKSPLNPHLVTRNETVSTRDQEDAFILDRVSVRWYREFRKAIQESFDYIDQFPDVPLLVMQAGEDYIVDQSKTLEWFHKTAVKEKTYKEWEGFYHELFNEPDSEIVYQYTLQFLQQQLIKS